ncbi:(2Fe-2S)-binding protein [soil metagenome]
MSDRTRIEAAVTRPAPIRLVVNGQAVTCYPGETVATALLASGINAFGRTASGAPRAPVCNMGVCFECVVTIEGNVGVRSCMTRATDNMCIEVPNHG